MIPNVLLSLMLASPPAPIPVETVRTYDLGKMTFEEAKKLNGKAVRVSFVIVGLMGGEMMGDEATAFAMLSPLELRSIRIRAGVLTSPLAVGGRLTVEGIVKTWVGPPNLSTPKALRSDTQIQDARPVRP